MYNMFDHETGEWVGKTEGPYYNTLVHWAIPGDQWEPVAIDERKKVIYVRRQSK